MTPDRDISMKAKEWWIEGYARAQVIEKAIAYNNAMNGEGISANSVEEIVQHISSHPPNHWVQQSSDAKVKREKPKSKNKRSQGELSSEIMNMPGFVSDLKDHTMSTSVYPNEPMAFAAAVSWHMFQISRKVTDPFGTTANTYIMGLSPSGSGKDQGRQVNKDLASAVIGEGTGKDISCHLGDQFASAEGIEDAMMHQKVMLYQNDEFDKFLNNTSKGMDIRYNNLQGLLLRMYTEAKTFYTMRRLAKDTETKVIFKPHLILFATAVPDYFYDSVNQQMLDNGFYSRLWTIIGNRFREYNLEFHNGPIPDSIIEEAQAWNDFGGKDFLNLNPDPFVIQHDQDAWNLLMEIREQVDARYNEANNNSNTMEASVWARVFEGINKFALGACTSRNRNNLQITTADIEIAHGFLEQQTDQSLYMADQHVHTSDMDKAIKKAEHLLISHNNTMSRSNLMNKLGRLSKDSRNYDTIINTMRDMDLIEVESIKGRTKPTTYINYIGG